MLVIFVGGPVVFLVFGALGNCTEEERQAFAEFPQFGGREMEPQHDTESGECVVVYDTRASQEQVAKYYAQQLKGHGWTVDMSKRKATVSFPQENAKKTVEQFEVTAHRDNLFYEVFFESHQIYDPPRPGAHVAVHVFEGSGNAPAPRE